MQLLVKIEDQEVQDLLKQVSERVSDMTPVMRTIGETIARSIRKNFETGGRPDAWKKSKRAESEGGQTLINAGILKDSINVMDLEQKAVTVGTSDERARTHHFGAKKGSFGTFLTPVKSHPRMVQQAFGRPLLQPVMATVKAHGRNVKLPWGDIPARPFMMIQNEDWDEIKIALAGYLEGT